MEKKKLLFLISQLHKGGAENSVVALLNSLPQNKYEADLVVMNQVPVERAISLIPSVHKHIRVCDAYQQRASQPRLVRGTLRRIIDNPTHPETAIRFVAGQKYDLAIHVGEWWAPDFLARHVHARLKMVWIHTDIASSYGFAPNDFFACDEHIDRYLFVSRNSMKSACRAFPFIADRSSLLHNALDKNAILQQSKESTDINRKKDIPLIITLANIRPEKNHLLQLEAMRILKERGKNFIWWNVGAFSFLELKTQLDEKIQEYGLQDNYLLLGPRENPYPFLLQADALASFSVYESWSLVITEAKLLGIPVAATQTSGAIEQLEDGKTALFADFTAESVADTVEKILFDSDIRHQLQENLHLGENKLDPLKELEQLLLIEPINTSPQNRILYVIDDVNYQGGAHVAAYNHIHSLLKAGKCIDIFSQTIPSARLRAQLPTVRFFSFEYTNEKNLLQRRVVACMTDFSLTPQDRKIRFEHFKQRANSQFIQNRHFQYATSLFSQYEQVCLLSEGSVYKASVANCRAKNKVQWIHTDYCTWRNLSDYTRHISVDDERLWTKMDKIVVLAPKFKKELMNLFPQFSDKIYVVGNLMNTDKILSSARSSPVPSVQFVSCFRFEPVKNIMLILQALERFSRECKNFHWTFIGDGEEWSAADRWVREHGLSENVFLIGSLKNPYHVISKADVFVQFSKYEGLPNTIYEALILGVPVLSSNVGAIEDQITSGVNGWLVPPEEDALVDTLRHIISHPDEIQLYKENLRSYRFDNDSVEAQLRQIFDVDD